MVRGREEAAWWHTAMTCVTFANVMRGPRQEPYRLQQFHPLLAQEQRKHDVAQADISVMRCFLRPEEQ